MWLFWDVVGREVSGDWRMIGWYCWLVAGIVAGRVLGRLHGARVCDCVDCSSGCFPGAIVLVCHGDD